ncbi:hypothetical protein B0H13DRAFT_2475910 [Mycena leptocephala]|nr:hypothetical protein B0H13DRAFT_2475910 [Mycena leptocephala]
MFTRALILSCVVIGIPAFGVYSIILVPRRAKTYTRSVSPAPVLPDELFYPTGNATIVLSFLTGTASITGSNTQAYVTVEEGGGWSWQRKSANFNCTVGIQNVYTFVECPQQWADVTSVTIQISIPPDGGGIWAKPIQGDLSLELKQLVEYLDSKRGAPILAGSRSFGAINWTQRNILSQLRWGISSGPTIMLFTAEVYGLQQYPSSEVSGSNITTLTLLQMDGAVTQILQDTVDDTLLSGISVFGGFWTFVNGSFMLFFGRRPLSALGVAHIFQRGALRRRWEEDFPAIHTEGGLPGSAAAGIVAFVRERLVDAGDSPPPTAGDPHHLKEHCGSDDSQSTVNTETTGMTVQTYTSVDRLENYDSSKAIHAAYVLDEIPLLNVDLGLGNILNGKRDL